MELAAAETSWSKLGVDDEGASLMWMGWRRASGGATRARHAFVSTEKEGHQKSISLLDVVLLAGHALCNFADTKHRDQRGPVITKLFSLSFI